MNIFTRIYNWLFVNSTIDEQIDAQGRCWRSNALVEQKLLKQIFFRITKYEDEPETYVAIFKHGYNPKCKSLWNKVRYIWQIIKTGQPFGDDIVLSKSDALRLSSLLNSLYK